MEQMELYTDEMRAAGLYLVELIRAALHEGKAAEKPDSVKWEQVYQLARKNSLEGISAYGVESLDIKPEDEIWKKWQSATQKVTYKVLHFDIEREFIQEEMKKAGLSYLPLKGVQIVHYYPKPGMRTMADNDILYGFVEPCEEGFRIIGKNDAEKKNSLDQARVCMNAIMKKRGYEIYGLNAIDDSYHKKPFFNYEMHKRLVDVSSSMYFYYENPWKRALQDEKDHNLFYFSNEDEYIYFLAHAYKHFLKGGCGLRLLTDTFVFKKKKGSDMNWDYIYRELETLQMLEFEKRISAAAENFFSRNDKELTEKEIELLLFLLHCGTYGTIENQINNSIKRFSNNHREKRLLKIFYLWDRFFPEQQWWETYYPICSNRRWLRPFFLFYRIGRGLVKHPGKVKTEWKSLWKKWK